MLLREKGRHSRSITASELTRGIVPKLFDWCISLELLTLMFYVFVLSTSLIFPLFSGFYLIIAFCIALKVNMWLVLLPFAKCFSMYSKHTLILICQKLNDKTKQKAMT